jgi:hypothetical protein
MPQDEPKDSPEIAALRKQMRAGRTPLLEAIRAAYPPYLIAHKGYNRKHEEVREQLGLLNSTFSASIKKLRESSRNNDDSGEGMIALYEAIAQQADAVSAFIKKESPGLRKLFEPVAKAFATYQKAIEAYDKYMEGWKGRLSESDLSGERLNLLNKK